MSLLLAALLGCGGASPPDAPPAHAPRAERAPSQPRPPAPDGPNVLLVVWDTVRADRTTLYDPDLPTTPLVARWAAERGVVYERAVSPGVFTLPSHASLFTGLPPRTHGVNADHTRLADRFGTVAEGLHEVGYDTWAFVANPYLMEDSGLLDGFARVERPWDPRWRPAVAAHVASKLVPQDRSTPLSPGWRGRPVRHSRYVHKEAGPVVAQAFDAWLDERPDDRPWFAFVNYMEAHLPRVPSLDARRRVMRDEAIARSYRLLQRAVDFHEWMGGVRAYDALDLEAIRGVYDASLVDLDVATQRLFEVLDRRGLADDTIVVLTSDHGEHLGEHRLLLHKYGVYNPLSRVPLVVAWPGHLDPGRTDAPFDVRHALVRALELGDVPLPPWLATALAERPVPDFDGVVTEYGAVADAMVERIVRRHGREAVDVARFLRTWSALERDRWKVIEASDGTVELYDVLADPLETTDLRQREPDVTRALRGALEGWRAEVPAFQPREGEPRDAPMDDELKEGLEALGYLQ